MCFPHMCWPSEGYDFAFLKVAAVKQSDQLAVKERFAGMKVLHKCRSLMLRVRWQLLKLTG